MNDLLGGNDDDYQQYRIQTIKTLSKLKFLDSSPVTNGERKSAGIEVRRPTSPASSFSEEEPALSDSDASATIVSYELRQGPTAMSKRFTVYKLVITDPKGNKTAIYRRYSDFYELYQQLLKAFPEEKLAMPPKRIIGDNFDPSFIEERRKGLHQFLQRVLRHPVMRKSPEVQDFLNTDRRVMPVEGERKSQEKVTLEDFEFVRVIGKGTFGKVMLGRLKKDNAIYAIKILSKKLVRHSEDVNRIMVERNVFVNNQAHPFLVGLRYSFQSPDKLYFVLDYVNGGELFFHLQRARRFPEERARFYAAEILCALKYLHSKGILYRDLKPENILLDSEGHVCVTDFGLAKVGVEADDKTSTFCGTPEYLAPEILKKNTYGYPVDWWCFGTVLYEMLVGIPPFYSKQRGEMYNRILYARLKFPPSTSAPARDIISKLLDRDPQKRLGAPPEDAEPIQRHAFFESIDWEKLEAKKVPVPYNPNVEGALDMKHIDKQYVNSALPKSILEDQKLAGVKVGSEDTTFSGFSYVSEDNVKKMEDNMQRSQESGNSETTSS
eukprot:NODE_254_length_1801_cov_92.692951_g227_i0.p1 GENE.NODE_254_length_1801_cov_92.692951_g227_i0~~NODE_254_length_1801_cov_92.692951_g227_i0.p1  ORF type:complete len:585 (+),score=112.44 NODE_254_length_1801_cov_92.692951_g227_i0:105-1757(+)